MAKKKDEIQNAEIEELQEQAPEEKVYVSEEPTHYG